MAEAAKKRRILVADDDKHCSSLLRDFLQDLGYDVEVVADGAALYRVAPEMLPDLIISDLDMPGLSGGTAQALLRVSPATRDIPIIFVTGQTQDRQARLVEFRPETRIFSKPIDLKQLAEAVKAELSSR
ncbi:MAG TPA: response regulator [Elusimicrobiota bacterium]|jgi:CheY-like chemotaxis protein|nr:response regulator [Elusimicrobiota bacterium]